METGHFAERLRALPAKPGVYLFKDSSANVLYVGKAASLRHRVRSYFTPAGELAPKLQRMTGRVSDFDYIVTDSEQEAVILECNLIKKHRPRYNVRLKDDKSYPYLKISLNEDYPRVNITRRFDSDGARYFGPFASASSIRMTATMLRRVFPFCSCRKPVNCTQRRACLEYYLHRCPGPCIGAIGRSEYRENVNQLVLFLEGKQERVIRELRRKMEDAAEKLQFERAAGLRDQVRAAERVTEQQKVVSTRKEDEDVVSLAWAQDEACAQMFSVRGGKLIGSEHFILDGVQGEESKVVLGSFVKQFYSSSPYVPPLILLPQEMEDMAVIRDWLRSKRGFGVELRVPRRGEKRKLVEMAAQNAAEVLEQRHIKWLADSGKTAAALDELRQALCLPRLPRRIECYDVSDIQGTSAVGSMVVFAEGQPRSSDYRRFRIKTVTGADDYAMLREVLSRRFRRGAVPDNGAKPGEVWGIVPDLILIDGGRGHLNAVVEAMRDLGAGSVPVASLAKANEEVFVPDRPEPIILSRNSQALYLIQRIRDEAHRFALAYHIKVRSKSALASAFDAVPGVGPKRRRALLKRFGSLQGIREAPVEELALVAGMTRVLAQRLKENL